MRIDPRNGSRPEQPHAPIQLPKANSIIGEALPPNQRLAAPASELASRSLNTAESYRGDDARIVERSVKTPATRRTA